MKTTDVTYCRDKIIPPDNACLLVLMTQFAILSYSSNLWETFCPLYAPARFPLPLNALYVQCGQHQSLAYTSHILSSSVSSGKNCERMSCTYLWQLFVLLKTQGQQSFLPLQQTRHQLFLAVAGIHGLAVNYGNFCSDYFMYLCVPESEARPHHKGVSIVDWLHLRWQNKTKQTPWPLVREWTIPTERPQLVGEI
jgi:hypothetical protein